MSRNNTVTVEEDPDHVCGVEVLARRDEPDGQGIEEIDAGVDGEFLAEFFLDMGHALAVEGEFALGDVDVVGDTPTVTAVFLGAGETPTWRGSCT